MSLSERLSTPPEPTQSGKECSVGYLLATLPADEAESLQYVLDHPKEGWTAFKIHYRVSFNSDGTPSGLYVAKQTVGRHRRGDCRCYLVPSSARSTSVNASEK